VRRLVSVTLAAASIGTASTAMDLDAGYGGLGRLGGLGGGDNTYGPGVGMDRYGRAYQHDPLRQVQRDAYGLGTGMDQYGRPVQHVPLFDW